MREYRRLESAATVWAPLSDFFTRYFGHDADFLCSEERSGFADCIPIEHDLAQRAWRDGLSRSGFGFSIVDSQVTLKTLLRYRLVIVPSFEFMDRGLQQRLIAFVNRGGTLLLGPRVPSLDEAMKTCSLLEAFLQTGNQRVSISDEPSLEAIETGGGRVVLGGLTPVRGGDLGAEFSKAVERAAELAGIETLFRPEDPRVETAFHRKPGKAGKAGAGVLFAANPQPERCETEIEVPKGTKITDLWESTAPRIEDNRLFLTLAPYSVGIFRVGT